MKTRLLQILRCPACLNELAYEPAGQNHGNGTMHCTHCGKEYGTIAGIPVLLLKDQYWSETREEMEGEEELIKELPESEHLKRNRFESWRSWNYLKKIDLPREPLVLDIGGSSGIGALLFESFKPHFVIIDIVPNFLQIGELCLAGRIAVDTAVAGMEILPFAHNVFDIVFCRQAIHHSAEPDLAFREMFRVVKPGGIVLLVSEPCLSIMDVLRKRLKDRSRDDQQTKYDTILDKLPDDDFEFTWRDYSAQLKPLTRQFSIEKAVGSAATVATPTGLIFDPYSNPRGPVGKFLSAVLPWHLGYRGEVNIHAVKTDPIARMKTFLDLEPVPADSLDVRTIDPEEVQFLRNLFDTFLSDVEW
jgi:SAM-dependent methyltransferase